MNNAREIEMARQRLKLTGHAATELIDDLEELVNKVKAMKIVINAEVAKLEPIAKAVHDLEGKP